MRYGILNFSTEASIEKETLKDESIHCFNCSCEYELPDNVSELEACMVWHGLTITKKTLGRLKKCKIIVCVGVGYNNVDIKHAGELGIAVVNIPDYGTNDVADHAFALLLSLCRKITFYNGKLLESPTLNWKAELGGEIHRLTGTALGIVGLGRIGSAVAIRAKAFGINVKFYDPYISAGYDKALNIERCESLNKLFNSSDCISIHAPLTDETNNMINSDLISCCKPGLTLVNTARGAIVNLDAVYDGLKKNRIKSFASDVMAQEPPDENHPLLCSYKNREDWIDGRVILTPHMAFYAVESRYEMRVKSALQMRNAVMDIPVSNCVNKDFLINGRCKING